MFVSMTIYQPYHGPHGEPYRVRARFEAHSTLAYFWTSQEAAEARDKAFDEGASAVHITGLPCRGAAIVPKAAPPLDIDDE